MKHDQLVAVPFLEASKYMYLFYLSEKIIAGVSQWLSDVLRPHTTNDRVV
jgi:hypothetical protein